MKELKMCLENCDLITISSRHIQSLDMRHIRKVSQDINTICQTTGQDSREIYTLDKITLILSKDANLPCIEHGALDETTVFKRLMKHRDIVSLTIVYEDGKEVTYYTPYWEDIPAIGNLATVRKDGKEVIYYVSYNEFEHIFYNKFQTTKLDDNGNLVIKIGDFSNE